jgi:hypothetical protein
VAEGMESYLVDSWVFEFACCSFALSGSTISTGAATAKKQKELWSSKLPKPENKNYNHFTPISASQRAHILYSKERFFDCSIRKKTLQLG